MPRAIVLLGVLLAGPLAAPAAADSLFFGPTVYSSFADSPFAGGSYSYFYLETFEGGSLGVPGVYPSGGFVIGNDPYIDSVDGDDGLLDGNGSSAAHSWYSGFTESAITFSFDPLVLGALPTVAGLVWTDIGYNAPTPYSGPVLFEAYGPGGLLLGGIGPYTLGDGADTGQTAEDRFFGVSFLGGISAIRILTDNTDWELDHLQFGHTLPLTTVPEPSTLMLLALGATCIAARRSRLRKADRAGRVDR